MKTAERPVQRPRDARLLYIDARGEMRVAPRCALARLLRPGDLLIANDAATLPASLHGVHLRSGRVIEVRLAARASLASDAPQRYTVIVFGAGDYRIRTEDRPAPPELQPDDVLAFGGLHAIVERLHAHPRLATLRFDASEESFWRSIAAYGRPIQYAYLREPLALWDVWTPIAGPPVAYEPPSAGFAIDWRVLGELRARGIEFATLTHAAGVSSTGDPELDRRLPFDEPYRIPNATAQAIERARRAGRRVVAVGTTVVRALEHCARTVGRVLAGESVATQRINAGTRLQVVDAILSGAHEPGASHHELLRAFAAPDTLRRADEVLNTLEFRTHEFGDSVLIERSTAKYSSLSPSHDVNERTHEKQALAGGDVARILRGFSSVSPRHVVQESHRLSTSRGLVDLDH